MQKKILFASARLGAASCLAVQGSKKNKISYGGISRL